MIVLSVVGMILASLPEMQSTYTTKVSDGSDLASGAQLEAKQNAFLDILEMVLFNFSTLGAE